MPQSGPPPWEGEAGSPTSLLWNQPDVKCGGRRRVGKLSQVGDFQDSSTEPIRAGEVEFGP